MNTQLILKNYRLKATFARCNVLGAILSLNGKHFRADDILAVLRHQRRNASRASTFRSIQIFHEAGILRLIEVDKYGCKFECELHRHHDHLCCMKCGAIIEFKQDTIEKLQIQVCKQYGFQATSHLLKINGICKKCSNRADRRAD